LKKLITLRGFGVNQPYTKPKKREKKTEKAEKTLARSVWVFFSVLPIKFNDAISQRITNELKFEEEKITECHNENVTNKSDSRLLVNYKIM
jgi:hypothetical protein